jgi:hypothetical protein
MFNVFTVLDLFISSLAHPSHPSSPLPGIKHRRKASHPSEVIDCLDPSTFLGMSLEAGKTAIVVADVVIRERVSPMLLATGQRQTVFKQNHPIATTRE